jgi:hypothetical protein
MTVVSGSGLSFIIILFIAVVAVVPAVGIVAGALVGMVRGRPLLLLLLTIPLPVVGVGRGFLVVTLVLLLPLVVAAVGLMLRSLMEVFRQTRWPTMFPGLIPRVTDSSIILRRQ